ncbi:MAG: triose-phosphate isomerase [Chloroflexota bacterium]
MRIPMIAGNWKMNTTLSEAVALVKEMRPALERIDNVDKLVCPPFISLAAVAESLKGSPIRLGAQNLHFEAKGAYTGEISPAMLAELCQFVIIGHSERRHIFGESGEIVNKKIVAAQRVGLKPILCVGERLEEENEAGKTEEVVTGQMDSSLAGIEDTSGLIIAYEPVWAIGTGRAATAQQANDTIGLIRRHMAHLYSAKVAQDIRILYGGSVNAQNTVELLKQPEIDGALVGGASLKADQFVSIAQQTSEITEHS